MTERLAFRTRARSLVLAAILLTTVAASIASAQERSPFPRWALAVGAGIAVPTGGYADALRTGPVVDLSGEYAVRQTVSVVLLAGVVSNPPKAEFAPPNQDASARLYRLFLLGRYTAAGSGTRFFGDVGLGAVNRKLVVREVYGNGTEVLDESRTRFGALAGAGVVVPVASSWDLLPEVSYQWLPLSDDPVLDAAAQNSVLATLALRLRFGG